MKGNIIVIDDEELMLQYLEKHLTQNDYKVTPFQSAPDALKALDDDVDLVISDVKMPALNGDEVLGHIREHHAGIGVILITGYGSINHAVRTVQRGAFDYITKPFGGAEILARVNAFFKHVEQTGRVEHAEKKYVKRPIVKGNEEEKKEGNKSDTEHDDLRYEVKLIGQNDKIKQLVKALPQIAKNNAPVLIQGESGTGKEVFASLIHYNSPRADKPYIKINCANLPRELVESTLFGHVKGAFTGAVNDKTGAFEEADEGTLLLDEITEVDIAVQAKLLRVLQESEFQKVGSQKTKQVDVRVIATTNRSMAEAIKKGDFREDLYYRLNVFPIALPALRNRADDIPLLAHYFCEKYAHENDMGEKVISDELMDYLKKRDWKGNIRELSNMIQRGVLMSGRDKKITIEHIKNLLFTNIDEDIQKQLTDELPLLPIDEMELKMIDLALKKTDGNQKEAAELLGISDRTIRNKLKKRQD